MNINCKELAERYLLNQNPLYTLSFPISILFAIVIFGMAKAFKWSSNSYINQILIPILSLLLMMVILDIISRTMISPMERNNLIHQCRSSKSKPIENFSSLILPEEMPQYKKDAIIEAREAVYSIDGPISPLSNIIPYPLESKPLGEMCIQNSNCCGLCSGSGSNPCNLIAPIPGPQWLPQSAKTVQERMAKNEYTAPVCNFKRI